MPTRTRKTPLTIVITLMNRLILSKAERNELKAKEDRKKGTPSPSEYTLSSRTPVVKSCALLA
jgi:hypothetical protein